MPSQLEELSEHIHKFCLARGWKQFHNPKDLAISICLEASEVLEHFQWKSEKEIAQYIKTHKEEVADELADVFVYLLTISRDLDIDLAQALKDKMAKNAKRYPVEKAKGNYKKHGQLGG
ncbi:MAG: nucleotide pyrophosphohydrolase [Candidatus Pacebacteria bacterium]|nr:nucleotide pyrophosphohydrolase [Candidatus Paceibacterota bacterium]